jgi:hypothetical protein
LHLPCRWAWWSALASARFNSGFCKKESDHTLV